MSKLKHNLHKELVTEGASPEEASSLAEIADRLKDVPTPKPLLFLRRSWWTWQRSAMAAGLILLAILAGGGLVAFAQTSQPASALYPVKRASEKIVMQMDPDFRARVMMRRVTEIDSLVSAHAPADIVLSDIHTYEQIAPQVKIDAATRDYCTDHLEHAAGITHGSEQQAIQQALTLVKYSR